MTVGKLILLGALAAVAACTEAASPGGGGLALTTASPDDGLAGTYEREGVHYELRAAAASETDRTATVSRDGVVIAMVAVHESSFEMSLGGTNVHDAVDGDDTARAALVAFAASPDGAALEDLVAEVEAIGGERPELATWTGMYSMLVQGMALGTDPALSFCIICHPDGNGNWFCWYCFNS